MTVKSSTYNLYSMISLKEVITILLFTNSFFIQVNIVFSPCSFSSKSYYFLSRWLNLLEPLSVLCLFFLLLFLCIPPKCKPLPSFYLYHVFLFIYFIFQLHLACNILVSGLQHSVVFGLVRPNQLTVFIQITN